MTKVDETAVKDKGDQEIMGVKGIEKKISNEGLELHQQLRLETNVDLAMKAGKRSEKLAQRSLNNAEKIWYSNEGCLEKCPQKSGIAMEAAQKNSQKT